MSYDPYSATNQKILDGAVAAASLYLAFLIRYDGSVPAYHAFQFWVCFAPLAAGRLAANFLFGLGRLRWRYIGVSDAFRVARSYAAFSGLLLAARFGLPDRLDLARIPGSVIAIELALSLLGALGIRFLRRSLYERQARDAEQPSAGGPRRLLLIGAGQIGARVAGEMASHASIEVVGYLDDDPRKQGCVVAGAKVLGPASALIETVRAHRVDDVLVCIAPAARGSFNRLLALLDGSAVTARFVPTIQEILDAKDGHLALDNHHGNGRRAAAEAAPRREPVHEQRMEIRNKNILITGGAGFIGSALAGRLAGENQMVLFDRSFRDQPVEFTGLPKHPNVRLVEADILQSYLLDSLAKEADIVVHAAAIVGVGRVCSYPRETLETNFAGTSRILKALEGSARLERFIYFSTSEVFGVNSFRVHEDAPAAVGPAAEARWSYAIAKLAGEHLVKAYHRQGGMPVVTVRPFNVFGPRRLGAHAILEFALHALTKTPIEVHGDGSQIRSWCYIEDFCDALVEMIARPGVAGEDFNIGNPANTLTILQLAQRVVELTGKTVPINLTDSPFPDIGIRVPSLDKARRLLGYRPSYDLESGLRLTIDWYRQHLGFFEKRVSRAAVGA